MTKMENLAIKDPKTVCPWVFWTTQFEFSDLSSLELIIQRPKIDFDILLGAKGLFAKEQNHRFNQRFSTLLLLTFDLTLLLQQ